jgi:hypothetical protein
MGSRLGLSCVLTAVLAWGAVLHGAETLRIVPIAAGNELLVSFELADAFTPEVRDAIASGLRTTFTYDVDLRMVVPGWLDRTVATAVVTATDQYDNLTRRHSLSRAIDGRVVEALVTENEATAREWLTTVKRMALLQTSRLDASRDYFVRVRARRRPSGGSLLAWANNITAQARFTLIP